MQNKTMHKTRRSRRWATRLLAATGLMASIYAVSDVSATVATFPNMGWTVALNGGQPVTDVQGDTQGGRDIVGDAANPMLYISSDATHLFFRLRVDDTPLQNATNFRPFGWGCLINTDSDLTTFEYSAFVDGVSNPDELRFYQNTVTATPNDPTDPPEITVDTVVNPLAATVGHARVTSAGTVFPIGAPTPDFFLEWAYDLTPLLAAGFNPANPANYYCGTSNNGATLGADCSGGTICGALDTEFTDPIACGPMGCAICGDGVVGAAEGCDDSNFNNGDGCNSLCQIELTFPCMMGNNGSCASGFCDPSNNTCACDENADCASGQSCATTPNPNACVAPGCGNTVIEAGEGCDDGGKVDGDGCNAECLLELNQACTASGTCASGFCDPDASQCKCDDSADCPSGQSCNTAATPNACVAIACGNGVVEAGEGCDDGGKVDGDGCNASCLIELNQACTIDAGCASGFCDPTGNICACDADTDCPSGQTCNTTADPNQCQAPGCGNGTLETGLGEGCDDNNTTSGDGCNAQCKIELTFTCMAGADSSCASGFCDPTDNTCACDADVDCPGAQLCKTTANPNTCVAPGCGNGVVEPATEGCDDGGMVDGDGCNAACLKENGQMCVGSAECASNFCDGGTCACDADTDCAMGEICKTSTTPNSCVMAGCGNGVIEAGLGEGCDDGGTMPGDGCNATCKLELGETCAGSSSACASGFCDPNGDICACDANNDCPMMGQLCNTIANPNICVASGCGNAVIEPATEACDDGNTMNGDGCNMACLLEIGQTCAMSGSCASGFCDATDNTCACDSDADCPAGNVCDTSANPNACVPSGCGNGVLEGTEGCDDGNMMGGDGCNAACKIELTFDCTSSGECASNFCDPADNTCACDGDNDCASGESCDTSMDPNVCVAMACGNNVVEANEGCDDGGMSPGDGCSANCLIELGEACSASTTCESGNCDGAASICTCDEDADCATGEVCDTTGIVTSTNTCVPAGCGNNVVESGEGCDDGNKDAADGCSATCLIELGIACTESTGCESGLCDSTTNVCTCDENADCPADQVCNTTGATNVCETPSDLCTDDTDCTGGLFCDEPSGACVECTKDTECGEGTVCDETTFSCVQCTADSECSEGVCDEAAGACVQCTADSECGETACNVSTQTCEPEGVIVQGSGCACTVVSSESDDKNMPAALLGLLGLALGIARRRR